MFEFKQSKQIKQIDEIRVQISPHQFDHPLTIYQRKPNAHLSKNSKQSSNACWMPIRTKNRPWAVIKTLCRVDGFITTSLEEYWCTKICPTWLSRRVVVEIFCLCISSSLMSLSFLAFAPTIKTQRQNHETTIYSDHLVLTFKYHTVWNVTLNPKPSLLPN
jgi:hypothetical protein